MTTIPVTKNRFSDTYSNNRKLTNTFAQLQLLEMLGKEHIPCRLEEPVPREGEFYDNGFPKQYFIDVFVPPSLAIEVNGKIHGRTLRLDKHDAAKILYLENHGYTVLSFTNKEVIFEAEKVLNAIKAETH